MSQVKGDLYVSDLNAFTIELEKEGQIQGMREEKMMSLVWDMFEVLWSNQGRISQTSSTKVTR